MVSESKSGQMGKSMKVNGGMERCMDKARFSISMTTPLMDIGNEKNKMGQQSINIKKASNNTKVTLIKDIGTEIKLTDKEFTNRKTV